MAGMNNMQSYHLTLDVAPKRMCMTILGFQSAFQSALDLHLLGLVGLKAKCCENVSESSGGDQGGDVCDMDSCAELSTLIGEKMNTSISPCEDFYGYTCGMFDTAAAAGGMWHCLAIVVVQGSY